MREMLHICYMQYVDSLRMQNVAKENETLSRHHKKKSKLRRLITPKPSNRR